MESADDVSMSLPPIREGGDSVTMRTKTVVGILVGAYLLGVGMLVGMVVDRIRFDGQRSEVLGRYEQALRDWQTYRIALEKSAERRR